MKYVPPYGRESEGDSAQYVNGDPSVGRQGSIPPANAFEHPMREIVHVIEKNLIVPDSSDLYQLVEATRSQRVNYAQDTGSANNLSVSLDPPLSAYTLGLVLRVRVANSNTGASRINAGAGVVPIRKMSGADTAVGDLPAGGIIELVYDGTVFQLTNYGGGAGTGGPTTVYEVKIPYAVDISTTPGQIIANFSPAITTLNAGDEVAVKIANTAPGPTTMKINAMAPINLAPNSGGEMLQGDLHAGAVVVFFYDGNYLYFAPDPEIDAAVTYQVGPGQHFPDVNTAMNAIKRKTIGANGYVTLQLSRAVFAGNIFCQHPSADRILFKGTMIGPAPLWSDFAANGNDPAHQANDAAYNINMLRARYGTEIQVPTALSSYGIMNSGPGTPLFQDILITGAQMAADPPGTGPHQVGVLAQTQPIFLRNVSVWGCQIGWWANAHLLAQDSFVCAGSMEGAHVPGGVIDTLRCGFFGFGDCGVNAAFGEAYVSTGHILMCAGSGIRSYNGSSVNFVYSVALGNATFDLLAQYGSNILSTGGSSFGTASPAVNTVGNVGSTVAVS